jgi:exopolysaccharide production protein ExoF
MKKATPFRPNVLRNGALAMGLVVALTAASAAAEPYTLNVSDKINVRVVQWKAAESTFEEWTALGGEYIVGPSGTTAFPFVGDVESAGKTSQDLARELADGLKQSLGLVVSPNVSIEIAEFAPIYVAGDVQSPGEYKFLPGLTLIKALSLAGGERRGPDANARPERDMLTVTGAYQVMQDEQLRLLAKRARIDAELAGKDTVVPPEQFAGVEGVEPLLADEQAVLVANLKALNSQSTALDSQTTVLQRQIETFGQKRTATERQLTVAQEQLTNVRSLANDGLAVVSRVASLETSVADFETRLLDIDMAQLQAQQAIGDAELRRSDLADSHASGLTVERQEVEAQLAEINLKLATQQGLLREAVAYSGIAPGTASSVASYTYSIVRNGEEIAADMSTPVLSGDVVQVRLVVAE